jgi:micrococcal nuclease
MRFLKQARYVLVLVLFALFGFASFSQSLKNKQNTKVLGEQDSSFETVLVSRVIDGDTIELEDGRKVRYIGINTPETSHPSKGVECYGQQSKIKNIELVEKKYVKLEKDVSETDRYKRLLRYVWLEDELINEKLVEDGFAFASSYPPDVKRQDELKAAEVFAKENNLGLWGECDLEHQAVEFESNHDGCVIKGNVSDGGKLYHLPECGSYSATKIDERKGEKWFCTEQEATAAGWIKSGSCE